MSSGGFKSGWEWRDGEGSVVLDFKTLLMVRKSTVNQVTLEPRSDLGLRKLRCRVFMGTWWPVSLPHDLAYVFFPKWRVLQTVGLVGTSVSTLGKEALTRDHPAKLRQKSYSGG